MRTLEYYIDKCEQQRKRIEELEAQKKDIQDVRDDLRERLDAVEKCKRYDASSIYWMCEYGDDGCADEYIKVTDVKHALEQKE